MKRPDFNRKIKAIPDPRVAGRWTIDPSEKDLLDAVNGPRRRKPSPRKPGGEQTSWLPK